ncbi:hypothetical protein H8356DRAFT_1345439 [Neocallimastix lanati (nom. inval.)]|nr:hypothetical protein H8356DRAFT_1338041 [Neocallimastix sp. JGI-2020a]KAG4094683.1 hypothetical protein H8356DRAFT_1345439 [Neocallimastix sp. JGI-2020a]
MSMDFNLELRNNTCTITCQYFDPIIYQLYTRIYLNLIENYFQLTRENIFAIFIMKQHLRILNITTIQSLKCVIYEKLKLLQYKLLLNCKKHNNRRKTEKVNLRVVTNRRDVKHNNVNLRVVTKYRLKTKDKPKYYSFTLNDCKFVGEVVRKYKEIINQHFNNNTKTQNNSFKEQRINTYEVKGTTIIRIYISKNIEIKKH